GRLGDAGAWWPWLFAPHAVRAHLSPPPPLQDHRRLGGGAKAPHRAQHVPRREGTVSAAAAMAPPAADPDFEPAALREFLTGYLGTQVASLSIRSTEGGMSNPTYFVEADGWRAVLRKQPRMQLAKSAHAI